MIWIYFQYFYVFTLEIVCTIQDIVFIVEPSQGLSKEMFYDIGTLRAVHVVYTCIIYVCTSMSAHSRVLH